MASGEAARARARRLHAGPETRPAPGTPSSRAPRKAAANKAEALRKAEAERQAELAAISAREAEERKAADVARKLAAGNAGETCREEAEASIVDVRTSWMEEHCRWVPLHERAGRDSIDAATFEHDLHDDY